MVPTTEEFDALREALRPRERPDVLPDPMSVAMNWRSGSLSVDELAKILGEYWDGYLRFCKSLDALPAGRWLDKQQGFKRAEKTLSRHLRSRSGNDLPRTFAALASRLLEDCSYRTFDQWSAAQAVSRLERMSEEDRRERHERENELSARARMFHRQLLSHRDRPMPLWIRRYAEVLQNYFHGDPVVEITTGERLHREALAALALAKEALGRFEWHFAAKDYDQRSARSFGLWLVEGRLARLWGDPTDLGRKDSSFKQRWLLHEMRKAFARPSTTALGHLLNVEGIDEPLDARTVERHIKRWRDDDRRKTDARRTFPAGIEGAR